MIKAAIVVALFALAAWAENHTKPGVTPIDVYIVTHTHDDVGWIIPVDQYYNQQVQFILDSAIQNLADNPERKFTYVEIGYFERWWHQISPEKQALVQQLYQAGQLEFNVGGITMNDEATTTYYEEINQMTEGARFLADHLDATPKSIWHVDPFGHSAVTASLWKQAGFPGFVLDRIPTDDRAIRQQTQTLEFVWQTSKSLGDEAAIFCHVLDNMYCSPGEMDFNDNDGWNGIYVQDDPTLTGYNVDSIVSNFIKMVQQRSTYYRHNKLLLPFGCDFAHREAYNSFVNMDKLIKWVNVNTSIHGVSVKYAHLSEYMADVQALNITWPTFTGDFFPYSDCLDCFWSGYFTSRPELKLHVRQADAVLSTAETLYTLGRSASTSLNRTQLFAQVETMRQATSIATHHDGVSGTETQVTANDYQQRLTTGWAALDSALPALAAALLPEPTTVHRGFGASQTIAIHNPLAWARREIVSLGVGSTNVVVTDSNGQGVQSQVNPTPSYSFEPAPYTVFFYATVPPLGLATYTVTVSSTSGAHRTRFQAVQGREQPSEGGDAVISNEFVSVTASAADGKISSIQNLAAKISSNLTQDLWQYRPARAQTGQSSGAYIFRPETNSAFDIGDNQGNDYANRRVSTILMPPAYPDGAIFVASLRGQDFGDSFSINSRSISATSVVTNTYRVDAQGNQNWGQDLNLDYISWTPSAVPDGFQAGTAPVGTSDGQIKIVDVTFPTAFGAGPVVAVTVRGYNADDSFTAHTVGVSASGFTALVYRTDAASGWATPVSIDWVAHEATQSDREPDDRFKAAQAVYAGTVTVGPNAGGDTTTVIAYHPATSINPLIVVCARGQNQQDAFVTLVRGQPTPVNFTIDIYALSGKGWTQNLQVDWMVIPRIPIQAQVVPAAIQSTVLTGPIVQEIRQTFRAGYGQTVRLFSGDTDGYHGNAVHVQHSIGPMDLAAELVTRWTTDLDNQGIIYTDDNGLEFQQRLYNYTKAELVAGNYYPMVSRAYLQDTTRNVQLTFLSDSTHGAGGVVNGELEIMLHRRCIDDDQRGVGEVLNETLYFEPSIWVVLADIPSSARLHRRLSLLQQFPLQIINMTSGGTSKPFSPLSAPLPDNVHLLSLRDMFADSPLAILRLAHVFEVGEDATLSQPAKVDLSTVFAAPFSISNVTAYNLIANTPLSEIKRPFLRYEGGPEQADVRVPDDGPVITLNPMEIKTFVVNFS